MMGVPAAIIFLFSLLCPAAVSAASVRGDITWTGGNTINDMYQVLWSYDWQNEEITFQVKASVTGYVALGITETGSMQEADIFFAWVENDQAHVLDCHGPSGSNGKPVIDDHNDLELISGSIENGETTIIFKRKLRTCDDPYDINIDSNSARMIYAYSNTAPTFDTLTADIPSSLYHGTTDRGHFNAYLASEKPVNPELPADAITIDMRNKNITIPNLDTTYWCQMFKIDKQRDLGGKKHHLIMSDVIIGGHEEKNAPYVHHLLLYRCNRFPDGWQESDERPSGGDCYDRVSQLVPLCIQDELVAAWAVGGEPFYFPSDVGLPIGLSDTEYYMMDFHYDNPALASGVVDDSGARLVMTPTLREHDAGVIFTGMGSFYHTIIPPGDPDYILRGNCHMNCTEAALPESGVKVFAGFLHTHLLGHGVTIKQIRDGVELPYMFQDLKYDFNYQTMVTPPEEIELRQGDAIQTQCHYDSTGRNQVTYGGLSTKEEMCLSFIFYYPKAGLPICLNNFPPPQVVGAAIGIQKFYPNPQEWAWQDGGRQGPLVEVDGTNYTWTTYLNTVFEWDAESRKTVEGVGLENDIRYDCGYIHPDAVSKNAMPQIPVTQPYVPPTAPPCHVESITTTTPPSAATRTSNLANMNSFIFGTLLTIWFLINQLG